MKVGSSFSRIDLVQANEYAVKHNIDDLKLKTLKKIFLRGKDTDRENMGLKSRCWHLCQNEPLDNSEKITREIWNTRMGRIFRGQRALSIN